MCIYGYCRISTKQQSIERQIRNIEGEYDICGYCSGSIYWYKTRQTGME